MPERLQVWKTSSREFDVVKTAAVKTGDAVRIEAAYLLAAGNLCIMRYTVHPSGVVETRMTFTSPAARRRSSTCRASESASGCPSR